MTAQITPCYPPVVSGIGDYASTLVQHGLFAEDGIHTVVASATPSAYSTPEVQYLKRRDASELCETLENHNVDTVLLHYSPYGYASRGLCYWLVHGLKAWKAQNADRRLITIFHEVYATGPIWRSSFWTALPQRQIARDISSLSNYALVTSAGGYRRVNLLYPGLPTATLQVFSNIGEPAAVDPYENRLSYAVIFGGSARRDRAYQSAQQNMHLFSALIDTLGIEQFIDIGPGSVAPTCLCSRPVRALGSLCSEDVSAWLLKSRVGMFHYENISESITKSGIAAAYFAHGLLVLNVATPVMLNESEPTLPFYISLSRDPFTNVSPSQVALAGNSWYQENGSLGNSIVKLRHLLA